VLAKSLLNRKGVAFEEINLDGRVHEVKELTSKTGHRTMPQIFIDGRMIGGFREMAALDISGELDQMLGLGAKEQSR
jgi:glutaredoxin 3